MAPSMSMPWSQGIGSMWCVPRDQPPATPAAVCTTKAGAVVQWLEKGDPCPLQATHSTMDHTVTHTHALDPFLHPGGARSCHHPSSSCERRVAVSHGQAGLAALCLCPACPWPRTPQLHPTPAAHAYPTTHFRSPLLAPVTITVLPVRSLGHLRGSQARLLLAQRSSPSSSESRDQHGWLQALSSSMAGAQGPARAPRCGWGPESGWGQRSAGDLCPAQQPWHGTVSSSSPSLWEQPRASRQEHGLLGLSSVRRAEVPRSPSCHAGTLGHEPWLEPQSRGSRVLLEGLRGQPQ